MTRAGRILEKVRTTLGADEFGGLSSGVDKGGEHDPAMIDAHNMDQNQVRGIARNVRGQKSLSAPTRTQASRRR